MCTAQTGGGAATHSGTEYQNRVAAWVAVRILVEHAATTPWDFAAAITFDFLRCETLEPVDDLLIGVSNAGHVFLQAKHSITLGSAPDSEFAAVIDQCVRQYHAHPELNRQPLWDRPLDKSVDRLVLATSSRSSARVRQVLPTILNRIRTLAPNQQIDDSAVSDDEREVLTILKNHIEQSWRTLKGILPTSEEICQAASLMRVQTLDVDAGEAQEREAKDLLRQSVLKNPAEVDLAWSKIIAACATFAANRTGATRAELQRLLIAAGIDIKASNSYRADIEKLKNLSANSIRSLATLAEIRLSSTQILKLSRESTTELQNAANSGSLVVVGQPGAGKSGALHDLACLLEPVGDVLIFAVDQFDAGSLSFLRNELGCTHEIVDILDNWPGTRPGFLIIDALDAARTEANAKTFRDLIGLTLADRGRWRVIPSIRKFDLRYSTTLKSLFSGSPPSRFQDNEFKTIRHLEIPVLSDAEFAEVSRQSNQLGTVIASASVELHQLLRVPFSLRLVAEMISGGATINSLTPIRTQLELLDRYWQERVICGDRQGDARESVLRRATTEMVAKRTLRIDRAVIADDPAASVPLHQIMSAQLLIEWQPSPENTPNRYVITYAHHIMFDYAVSRLLFRGPLHDIVRWLEHEPDLLLAVRPSLLFHYQYLWTLDQNRRRFWDCIFAFFNSNEIPATGKIVGPLAATQLIATVADCQLLLDTMKDEQSPNHSASVDAFRHLLGGAHSSGTRPLSGENAPPWCEVLKAAAAI